MDDLRAILFYAHGVVVMTQGLRIIGAGLIISLGLGCHSTDKLEPLPLPAQLPSPEYMAPEPSSSAPTTQRNGNRPSVSVPNPYPSVQTAETSPPGFENVSRSSIKVPDMTPSIPNNPATFQPGLPIVPPANGSTSSNIEIPQPPQNDLAGGLAAEGNDIRSPSTIQGNYFEEIRIPEK